MKRSLSFIGFKRHLIILWIKRVGYDSENRAHVDSRTGFTFFVICGYVLMALIFFIFPDPHISEILKINPNFAMHFRKSFGSVIMFPFEIHYRGYFSW